MLDLSLGFGLCVCALLAALTLSRRPLSQTDTLLAGWLASYAVFFLGWIGADRLSGEIGFALAVISSSAVMLAPVFHWMYARAAAGDPVTIRWPHLVPSTINLGVLFGLSFLARAENAGGAISVSVPREFAILAVAPVVILLAISIYPILAWRTAAPREAALKNVLSDERAVALNWVRIWAGTTLALNLALIVVSLASNTGAASVESVTAGGAALIAAQILYVAYKGLRSGAIVKVEAPAEPAAVEPPPRLDAFEAHMASKKPYLKPDLTITALADQLGWQREEVTRAVRAHDANFFDCINRYRVEEAKRLISDPSNAGVTLLSLGYDAGFGSKSAFNAAFRRHLGVSPSEFRTEISKRKSLN